MMKVVSDVSNGADGWAMYQQVMPDIVITDLRMPVMDGMELIGKIRESAETAPKIVILSCLDDFDMVRKALKYGVSDYILKLTMTPEEMEAILIKLVNELEQEGRMVTNEAQVEGDRKSFSSAEFIKRAAELQLRLDPSKKVVGALMEIDAKGPIFKQSVLNVLDEIMSGFRLGEPFFDHDFRYFLVANLEHADGMLPLLEHIKKVMHTYFNANVTFGISHAHLDLKELSVVYTEAVSALEHKFFRGAGSFIQYGVNGSPEASIPLLHHGEREWLLNESDRSLMFDKLRKLTRLPPDAKQQVIWFFLQGLHWVTFSFRLTDDTLRELVYTYSKRLTESETLEETIACFEAYMSEIKHLRSQHHISKEVSQVMGWIEKHYRENLSLQQGAEMVEMSYNYFSMLFKREAGLSFIDYLQQVRIEKAKGLLLKTNKKLYEIMDEVGFTDQSYFSRTFKKAVGVRPSEFKRMWLRGVLVEMEETQ